jgi:hypothetical protein
MYYIIILQGNERYFPIDAYWLIIVFGKGDKCGCDQQIKNLYRIQLELRGSYDRQKNANL